MLTSYLKSLDGRGIFLNKTLVACGTGTLSQRSGSSQTRVFIMDGVSIDSVMEFMKHIVCVTMSQADFSWYVMRNMKLSWTYLSVYFTGRYLVPTML